MWKLNAGLERQLLLGMEIALPHVISHAKALLSTFTYFPSFAGKRICDGTVLLGRWIHFHSGTDGLRNFTRKHYEYRWSSIFLYEFYVLPATDLIIISQFLYLFIKRICELITPTEHIYKTEQWRPGGIIWWTWKWRYHLTQDSLLFLNIT